jgi:hypothetical protein
LKHGDERSKLSRHLVINFSKRPLTLKGHVLWISTLTLDDHVVYDHTDMHSSPSKSEKWTTLEQGT